MSEEAVKYAAAALEDISASDIAAIVTKAIDIMEQNERDEIGVEEIQLALKYIKPTTPRTAAFFTEIAVRACTDRQYLPPKYAALLDDRSALDKQIGASYQDSMASAETYNRGARTW